MRITSARSFAVVIALLGCAATLWAQAVPAAGQATPASPVTAPVQNVAASAAPVYQGTAPAVLAGDVRNNLVSYGLTASTTFDDNALGLGRNNFITTLTPDLRLNVVRPRWASIFEYRPAYSFNSELTANDSDSHFLGATLQLRATPRFTLTFRNQFSKYSNPLETLRQDAAPVFGVADRPNQAGWGENLDRLSEQAGLDMTYALDSRTAIGVGGGYLIVKATRPGTSIRIQDSMVPSANAFYSHRFTRRQTGGVQYRWQRIDARGGEIQSTTNSIEYFHSLTLTEHVTVSAFGGPEQSTSYRFGVPSGRLESSTWSWSGGATLAWRGGRNAANLSFVRRVNDAGVLDGVVRWSEATANYHRQLTSRTMGGIYSSYSRNRSFNQITAANTGDYVTAGAELRQRLSRQVSLTFTYGHIEQIDMPAVVGTPILANHNLASVSIKYEFERPIGK